MFKHSGAARASIDVFRREDRIAGAHRDVAEVCVVAEIWDDGDGGADPDRGQGLSGVRRRLAAFDGRLTVDSPAGGPTTVRLEVPGE